MDNPMAAWSALQKSWMEALKGGKQGETGGGDPFASWCKMWSPEGNPWPDASPLSHALAAFGSYNRLFDAWSRASSSGADSGAATEKVFGAWREIVEDFTKRWASLFSFGAGEAGKNLGADPAAIVRHIMGSVDAFREFYRSFYKPWQESMTKLAQRSAELAGRAPSAEVVEQFHKAWMEAYEETVGRFVKIPSVGPAREKYDLLWKGVDAMFRWQGASLEFALEMQIPAREAFEAVSGRLGALLKSETTVEEFGEFYEALVKETEKRVFELFKTERFAAAIRTTLSATLDLYKAAQDLMEEQLRATPVVTRKEMDEVEQELVALRRTVKAQGNELEALKGEMARRKA
ncbi:MAG: poly(R)-hydroxyalkanoic acid synthase subunit PhaE [Deltaproteobacteria bacterium]|nr:poly(R)-hydroxyalkanoic acid synthase subunit PhaE [Deltaproteobacteria bacterium]